MQGLRKPGRERATMTGMSIRRRDMLPGIAPAPTNRGQARVQPAMPRWAWDLAIAVVLAILAVVAVAVGAALSSP